MNQQTTLSSKMGKMFLSILLLGSVMLSSCSKSSSSSNDGAKFIGTWNGTGNCGSGPSAGSLVFTAGSDGGHVAISGDVGSGSCYKALTYNITASGNNLSCAETVSDLCGNSYTINITGTLSGTTLSLVFATTGAATGTCTFTGSK